jgi:hypothetical protein
VIAVGTRVTVHDMNEDVPEDHDGNGTVVEVKPALMGRLEPLHYVLFDGRPEAVAAWFYSDEFELLHEGAAQRQRPDGGTDGT